MDETFDAASRFASCVGADGSGRGEVHGVLRNVHEPVATMSRTKILISVGSGAVVLSVRTRIRSNRERLDPSAPNSRTASQELSSQTRHRSRSERDPAGAKNV